jgi:uncharacterized membrane protein (UPF0127 family)
MRLLRLVLACFLGVALPGAGSLAATPVNQGLPIVELTIAGHKLRAEVAADAPSRTIGLMNRFSLRPDHGMLFVFPEPQPLAFWMKNTYVPLSIAFIDAKGVILNIEDMKPHDETAVPSKGAALHALEMKQGWFRERGIKAGDRVLGLERAGRGR